MLLDRKVIEEARLISEEGELALGRYRLSTKVVPANADGSTRGGNDSRQATERCGFAGTVWAHKPEHLANLNRKGKLVYRNELAIKLGQAFYPDHTKVVRRPRIKDENATKKTKVQIWSFTHRQDSNGKILSKAPADPEVGQESLLMLIKLQ